MYHIYLLKSLRNGKIYVGFTRKDPRERLKEHNKGSNKWTKQNEPFKLLYWEKFVCKQDALLREKFFKSGQGKRLKQIIAKYY